MSLAANGGGICASRVGKVKPCALGATIPSASALMQRRSSGGDLRRLRSLTISTRKESEQEETLADPVAAQFDILKVLGAGSFSTVRHAIRRSDGRHFALKTISDPEKAEEVLGADAGKPFWLEDHEVWTEISPPCKAVLRHCLALKWTERPAPMVLLRCAWLQRQAAAAKERPASRARAGLEVADVDALLEVKRIACMIGKTTGFVQLSDALSDVCGGWSRQISATANSDTGFMSQESNTFARLLSDG